MKEVIATVIGLIIVLLLIGTTLMPQQEGIKQAGDKAQKDGQKINVMLDDPNNVTGTTAITYLSKTGVTVKLGGSTVTKAADFKETNVYKMAKTYDTDGNLKEIAFTLVDLSK